MVNLGAQHENLDQKVYQVIKEMIMMRKLLPGEKIPQERLAKDLGISRTPLISALKFLEQEKLVVAKPRRGYFVRLFSQKEMLYIFELREVLEGLAARRAASHITDSQIVQLNHFFDHFDSSSLIDDYKAYSQEDRRFHFFVMDIGAKEFLKSILLTTNIISFSYQVVSSEGLIRSPNETMVEHKDVIAAICDRDSEAAEQFMRQHFKKSADVLGGMIVSKGDERADTAVESNMVAELLSAKGTK